MSNFTYYGLSIILGFIDAAVIKFFLPELNFFVFTFIMCTVIYVQLHLIHMYEKIRRNKNDGKN